MKVILRENLKHKGEAGDVIEVKTGFARNYLIPQGLAYEATPVATKVYEQEKYLGAKQREKERVEAEKLKTMIEKVSLTVVMKVGEEDRLFGSVSTHTVADLLKEKGFDINHRKILIEEPIKELGVFEIGIDLGSGVTATIKVWVVKE